jgi:hypothetical protein
MAESILNIHGPRKQRLRCPNSLRQVAYRRSVSLVLTARVVHDRDRVNVIALAALEAAVVEPFYIEFDSCK